MIKDFNLIIRILRENPSWRVQVFPNKCVLGDPLISYQNGFLVDYHSLYVLCKCLILIVPYMSGYSYAVTPEEELEEEREKKEREVQEALGTENDMRAKRSFPMRLHFGIYPNIWDISTRDFCSAECNYFNSPGKSTSPWYFWHKNFLNLHISINKIPFHRGIRIARRAGIHIPLGKRVSLDRYNLKRV